MRYAVILSALLLVAIIFPGQPVKADTRYVGDQLIITLRQGKTTKHKILKTLKTGTPVEVLEEDSSYFKVRTTDGTEGYVLRQYISSSPPKSMRIDELEMENSTLRKNLNELEQTRSSLDKKLQSLQKQYEQDMSSVSASSGEMGSRLEAALENERVATEKYDELAAQSGDVINIARERDQLRQENTTLKAAVKATKEQNEKMADARMIKWFLAGAGVFFFGWLIGKISRKKRSRF